MNVLGIGKIGCDVADKFSAHEQYGVYKIGSNVEPGEASFCLKQGSDPEKYDEKPINPNFNINIDSELDVFVSGEDIISAATLRILENYKDCVIRIFYIKPNYRFLSETQKLLDKTIYNVLQEYTRSKKFDSMYILDYDAISKVIGKAPITQVQSKICDTICSTVHMINFLDNTAPIMSNYQEAPATYCLNTIGVLDIKKNDETIFHQLDNVREKRYYYCINEKQLNTDGDLFGLINSQMESKIEENTSIMFGVYSTKYESNYCYVVYKSPYIQK